MQISKCLDILLKTIKGFDQQEQGTYFNKYIVHAGFEVLCNFWLVFRPMSTVGKLLLTHVEHQYTSS